MSTQFNRGGLPARSIHRARQLCRQVHEELELTLGELEDDALDGLAIFAVEVEGGGTTLRIGIVVPDDRDPSAARLALEAARGRLREGIAAAIHRKRTPQLVFALIPATVLAPVEPSEPMRRIDLHGFDRDGMLACNPRDREAAHRAEVEGIATDDDAAVTCRRCVTALARARRDERR